LSLFLLRGAWMIGDTLDRRGRWVRIVPHVIDTVLLASAIGMTLLLGQYPGTTGWLTAKLIALIVYVVLGAIALRRGKTLRVRIAAFVGALATFAYIVAVAISRDPFPFPAS
jgi:uncharacterized membrane protein SirB2